MLQRSPRKISLPWVLVVPFVVQLLGVVGIVGYLSWRNGQVAVENLANRLMHQVCEHTALKLRNYFAQPLLINQINVNAIASGQFDLQDWSAVEATLFNRLQEFPEISGVLIGTAQGEMRAVTRRSRLRLLASDPNQPGQLLDYALTPEGQRLNLLQTLAKPDVRQMPWYQAAMATQQPVWSPVFQTGDGQDLSLNANVPIQDPTTGQVLGVASAGIVLSVIDQFLDEFRVSPNGAVFVIERDGLLLGSSTHSPIYEHQATGDRVTLQRLSAAASADPLVRTTANLLQESLASSLSSSPPSPHFPTHPKTFHFNYQGERLFVEVAPFKDAYGLELLIVVAVPERDFMAQIQANTRNTLWLCVAATGGAITLGLVTSRWIARPILQLSQASQRIATGDFQHCIQPSPIQEVDVMLNSFNQMSQKIQHYSQSLEDEVRMRTAALEQEICDRKQIETQLEVAKTTAETANQIKSEFLASMSHELRTPLNAILGFTQLMGYKGMVTKDCQDYLNIINQSGQHLLALINDVLDMSKIEANQIDLEFTHVLLTPLLENVEDLFSLKAEAKQLRLQLHMEPQTPQRLYTDESKLRQILTNLLSNAIKFTDQGDVRLVVRPRESDAAEPIIRFEVTDTGQGIDPQDLNRIFDPFIQTRNGQRTPGGTGLGLAISQQYAHLLGGQITVRSQVGQGSCFCLDLPIVQAVTAPETVDLKRSQLFERRRSPQASRCLRHGEESSVHPASSPGSAGCKAALPQIYDAEGDAPSSMRGTHQALRAMSRPWLQKLQRFAYHCNDQQILSLLDEIPEAQAALKHDLAMLAESYQFSVIVSLAEVSLAQPQSSSPLR
jgi:signal transduction histidine kinase